MNRISKEINLLEIFFLQLCLITFNCLNSPCCISVNFFKKTKQQHYEEWAMRHGLRKVWIA